jgi:hypothetical protein
MVTKRTNLGATPPGIKGMVTPFDLSNRTHAGSPANSDASSAMTLSPALLMMRRDQSIDDGTALGSSSSEYSELGNRYETFQAQIITA